MPAVEIEAALQALYLSRTRLIYGLTVVPEERHNWTPCGSAPTPVQLTGKVVRFLEFVAAYLREGAMPQGGGDVEGPSDMEEGRQQVEAALDRLKATLEALDEADLDRALPAPWGEPMTIRVWLFLIIQSLGYFQGQLNTIQLAYGDEEPNVPPEWRPKQAAE